MCDFYACCELIILGSNDRKSDANSILDSTQRAYTSAKRPGTGIANVHKAPWCFIGVRKGVVLHE